MTAARFRELALAHPEATEGAHMGHPDFRAGGKIFATLTADGNGGMVKLAPDAQAAYLRRAPRVFTPASGAWGRQGCTMVLLRAAREPIVREALDAAWRNTAPRRLVEEQPAVAPKRRQRAGTGVDFAAVRRFLLALPGVEEGPCYGTPGFRIRRRLLARLREDGTTLVVACDEDERELRILADPAAYFLTDHYRGYPFVLVRLPAIAPADLWALLEQVWRRFAPQRLVAARDGGEHVSPRRRRT